MPLVLFIITAIVFSVATFSSNPQPKQQTPLKQEIQKVVKTEATTSSVLATTSSKTEKKEAPPSQTVQPTPTPIVPKQEVQQVQPKKEAVPLETPSYYTNTQGNEVQSPTYYDSQPSGATARCGDGTYSFSQSRRGTCSHHGGVAEWY